MQEPQIGVEGEVAGQEEKRGLLHRLRASLGDRNLIFLSLVVILVLGVSMRLTGVNWDDQTHLHPDERFLTDVTSRLQWPSSIAQYFDAAQSPLNPYNHDVGMFVYGTAPVFLVKGLGILLDKVSYWQAHLLGGVVPESYSSYWRIHLVGRVVSALYDLCTVLLVYFVGRRLYGRAVGLLASALMAFTVLSIQHSHFYTVETFITLMITLAFFFTVRVMQGGGWTDWALMGATFGIAVAGKISMAMYLLVMGVVVVLRALREPVVAGAVAMGPRVVWRSTVGRLSFLVQADGDSPRAIAFQRGLVKAALGLLLALLLALVAFRVTQPYAFTGPSPFSFRLSPHWLNDMSSAAQLMDGSIDYPPSDQWTDRAPIWFAWRNIVLWGMGLPLGLTAWAGWLLAGVELFGKRKIEHLPLLLWVTFSFLYMSVQFVKSIRYFLPIYPLLVILAAYLLVRTWREARGLASRWRDRGRKAAAGLLRAGAFALPVIVVGGSFLYAEAYTNIYRRPLSRVTASRWAYDNIPPGSSITYEEWDDIIPQNVDGKDPAQYGYNLIKTQPYWEDSPEKRDALYQWLDEADYIILSSNRLYDSIPRLAERYPLTTAYYKYLFSGDLGFEVVKVFTSYPNLGPIQFIDDTADEAFSVYDHPKVTILHKTSAYSSAKVRELLGSIPVDRLVRMTPVQTMASHHGLMLTPEEQQAQQAGGTWSAMFDPASLANRVPVVVWLLVLELLALAALPLAFIAFPRFRDRGYLFAKTLGILLLAYLAWLGPSLHIVPYTRATIAGMVLLLLGIGGWLAWRHREEMRRFLRREWRYLLLEEGLFLAFFAAFLLVRFGNPDLWHPVMGGEKPMDLAYLNAIIKSTWFPPYDPWFAGGYINYYYFGQVIVATLCKLTSIVPTTAYNLALPTLFALTAMGAFSVVSGLLGHKPSEERRPLLGRAVVFGLFGALLVAVLGNLGQVRLLVNGFQQASQLDFHSTIPGLEGLVKAVVGFLQVVVGGHSLHFRPEWWYWNASRIMGAGEINEFPFFTFLYADLHAHLIALPFALLSLGLTVSLFQHVPLGKRAQQSDQGAELGPAEGTWARLRRRVAAVDWSEWLALGLLALTLGELRANNTWDYPTYLLVALAGLLFARVLRPEGFAWRGIGAVLVRFVLLAVASTLFFEPFLSRYGAAYTSVVLWHGPRTVPGDYLLIYGLFLFILVSYTLSRALGYATRGALARSLRISLGQPLRLGRYNRLSSLLVQPSLGYQLGWVGIVGVLLLSATAVLVNWWVLGVTLPLGLLALWLVFRRDLPPAERFAALLFAGGLFLTLAVEIVVLKGDIGRMNTVFKFYLQVWVLWGIAAAVALAALAQRWGRWSGLKRHAWQAGLGLLLFGAALYPLTATWGKINDRFDRSIGPSLDGTAYTETAVYNDGGQTLTLKSDMDAIRWLQENIQGSPVILEGNTPLYRWGSRISIYTGLPTVIGWDWHEKQQRAVVSGAVVGWRLDDVQRMYSDTDVTELAQLLKLYDVSYVYVGELERAYYTPEGLAKFDRLTGQLFDIVYQRGPVTIYKVRKESLGGLSTSPFPSENDQAGTGSSSPVALLSLGAPAEEGTGAGSALLSQPVDTLPVVDDRGWNPVANAGPAAATAAWWLLLLLIGLAAWPLCFAACRGLPDRGYLVAKAVGWLLLGYVLWAGASTQWMANRVPDAYAVLALLVAVGLWAGYVQRRPLAAFWRARRGLLLREEVLFSGAFLCLVLARLLNPDLWQPWFGGEKMMEFAYLNAIVKSAHFPPYDPYFAGGHINYYYYGLYLVNVLIKLTGVVPEVAFNLAVPTYFALAVGTAFSLGHALTARLRSRRWLWGGVAAALGVTALGNLTVLAQWLANMVALGGGMPQPESGLEALQPLVVGLLRWPTTGRLPLPFDYWYQATRVIPFTINEFPFFSYLFADLHPHMMSLPFTVAALAIVAGLLLGRRGARTPWLGLGLLALVAGALGPLNTWDLPAFLGLATLALVWGAWERGHAWRGFARAAGVAAASYLLYLPFYTHYTAPSLAVRLAPNHTGLRYFLIVWGLWLVALYSWLLLRWWHGSQGAGRQVRLLLGRSAVRRRRLLRAQGWCLPLRGALRALLWLLLPLAVLIALLGGEPVLAVLAPLAVLAVDLWLRPDAHWAERFAGLMAATGVVLLAGIELGYMVDFLEGTDWERMNTFFKFGIEAWVLLALAVAAGLPRLLAWLRKPGRPGRRIVWSAGMVALLGISAAYVPLGVAARVNERFPGGTPPTWTLDGLAYMETGVYDWPDESHPIELRYDLDAIRWLLANVRGTPVIAEAPLGYYREGGMRVASYTGLPTLVGAHQVEQRSPDMVYEREHLADELYRTDDPDEALAIMRALRVQYVYFGQLEENDYGPKAQGKFDALVAQGDLTVAYSNPKVTIYQRPLT